MSIEKDLGYALKESIFGNEETRNGLLEVKKDIVKEYISSIKVDNPNINDEYEGLLEKYLINDGSIEDVFQDIFRGCELSIGLSPESMKNLNIVKNNISSINKIPTSEELSTLKSKIMSITLHTQTDSSVIDSQTGQEGGTTEVTNHNHTETSPDTIEDENKFIKSIYDRVSKQIGKPYSRGGISPSTGFDCSGLWYRAFKEEGIKFSSRLSAHKFSDADVDISKNQVKPGDFMFWDQKPGRKKKHDSIYHIEMVISKPYTKNGKTYVRTLGSSSDAKDDRGNYVGKGVQIREREMKEYRHYGRPTYYYQLAQYQQTGSSDVLVAGSNEPSHDLKTQVLSA